jgi:hypothetical protein
LFHNLERYTYACSELRKAIEEVPPLTTKDMNILLQDRGCTAEELNFYHKVQARLPDGIASTSEVINVILTKYVLMLYKFKLKENNIGRIILDKIIMDATYEQFSIEANILSLKTLTNKDQAFDPSFDILSDRVRNILVKVSIDNPFDNKFIGKKAKQVLKSTLSLLDVPNEIIDKRIKYLQGTDIKWPSFARAAKEVAAICDEHMNKSA